MASEALKKMAEQHHDKNVEYGERGEKTEESEESNRPTKVIFDPSLLVPPFHILLEALLEDEDFTFFITPTMSQILSSPSDLAELLVFWGATRQESRLVAEWVQNKKIISRLMGREFSGDFEEFRQEHLVGSLRRKVTPRKNLVAFISDEICLALSSELPIFCTETSSWKIVEILRRSGSKVKKVIKEYGQEKYAVFRKRKTWKKVISRAGGAAFAWALGGPVAGLGALGAASISVAVEDP